MRRLHLATALAAALAAAPLAAQPPSVLIAPFSAAADSAPPAPWRVVTLPKLPRHSQYTIDRVDDRRVLRMESNGGYANLLHPLAVDAAATPWLRWRWRIERHPAGADLRRKEADDMPARVCVLFDLPLDRLRFGDRLQVQLGRLLFDPDLPAASLCYVWDATLPAGTWLPNAYTDRVQMLVLRSTASGDRDGAWAAEARDLRADFARAFPHEAAANRALPLAAVGVATDADNTGGRTLAYLGDLTLTAEAPQ